MNATAKSLSRGGLLGIGGRGFTITAEGAWVFVLLMAVLMSAVAVVYVKDLNRRLVSQVQTQQYNRDNLQVAWGQLLLEQGTLATQARVQHIAQDQLQMVFPNQKSVILVRQ